MSIKSLVKHSHLYDVYLLCCCENVVGRFPVLTDDLGIIQGRSACDKNNSIGLSYYLCSLVRPMLFSPFGPPLE